MHNYGMTSLTNTVEWYWCEYVLTHDNLHFTDRYALAGGPSPILLLPVQEYHPASDFFTLSFVKVAVGHPEQRLPEMSDPLNCHL